MEPIETAFVLVIYVLPIIAVFCIMAVIADLIENRRKQK